MKSEGLELLLIDFVFFLTLQSFGFFFLKNLFFFMLTGIAMIGFTKSHSLPRAVSKDIAALIKSSMASFPPKTGICCVTWLALTSLPGSASQVQNTFRQK